MSDPTKETWRGDVGALLSERNRWHAEFDLLASQCAVLRADLTAARAECARLRDGLSQFLQWQGEVVPVLNDEVFRVTAVLQHVRHVLSATPSAEPTVPVSEQRPKPSGDCITDRIRQNKLDRDAQSIAVAPFHSSSTYPLFKHMSDAYQMTLVESELDDIRYAVCQCGDVVPLAEAESLASAIERWADTTGTAEQLESALAAWRARHRKEAKP